MNTQADILIVTVTKVESKAVLDVFQEATGREAILVQISDRTYLDLGMINEARVFMVQSEMGSAGISGSYQTVQKGIALLSPTAVIMVGIAFGINPEKQKIGDILVSQRLSRYELQRIRTEGKTKVIPRGDRLHASPLLLDRFRSAYLDWDDKNGKVMFGSILSGEKLVDNIEFYEQLIKLEPEAIGGEMEGAGLYEACQRAKVDWILVKAISNWADGQKNDQNQYPAACNAARFVLHSLKIAPFVSKTESSSIASDAGLLKAELTDLSQELNKIQKEEVSDEQIQSRLLSLQKMASRAVERSDELTARMILPPTEMTDVRLLPVGVLERLEEYRSDENIAYLLIGAFGGGILGILSNWATNESFIITRFSVILLCLFAALCSLSMFWARRIHKRAEIAKNRIFPKSSQ